MTSPLIWWEHSDVRGMARALAEASARARAGAWSSDAAPGLSTGSRVADLRVLSLASLWAAERLSRGGPERGSEPNVADIDPDRYTSPERQAAALGLLRTWAIVMPEDDGTGPVAGRTVGGSAFEPLFDASALPAVAVITVVVKWSAITAGAFLVAREAAKVIDRQLSRSESTRRLVAAQAKAVEVVTAHADREAQAGHELPFTAGERLVLSQLGAAQDAALAPESPYDGASNWGGLLVPALLVLALLLAKDT